MRLYLRNKPSLQSINSSAVGKQHYYLGEQHMRYEEVRKYIRANQVCPDLTHAGGASASQHSGFIELLDAAYATYHARLADLFECNWQSVFQNSLPTIKSLRG